MSQLDRQIEIDVLSVLSDFVSRNQNDITTATGRDYNKSTDRVKVHRAIRRIDRYIERTQPKITKVGNKWVQESGNIWAVRKDIDNIKEIVQAYPELLLRLQSNEDVLSMLVDKHVNLVCTDEWLSDVQQRDFKKRLKTSATFFRLYLFESPSSLLKILETLFSITGRGQEFERLNRGEIEQVPKLPDDLIKRYGFTPYKPSFNYLLDVTFRTCVGADVLYGRECGTGIEFIKKMKLPAFAVP